jgi:hypothetical protein
MAAVVLCCAVLCRVVLLLQNKTRFKLGPFITTTEFFRRCHVLIRIKDKDSRHGTTAFSLAPTIGVPQVRDVLSFPVLCVPLLCYAMLCCNDYPPAHPHACACMYIYMYLAWLFRPRFVD